MKDFVFTIILMAALIEISVARSEMQLLKARIEVLERRDSLTEAINDIVKDSKQ